MPIVISALVATIISFGSLLFTPEPISEPAPVSFGAAEQFVGGSTYTLAGSGVSSSATSFTLTSLTIPQNGYKLQDSDFSTTFFVTLEPGNRSRQEFVSCTTVTQNAAGTATLSGCTRGLSPITPYTASSSLQFAHAGGTQVIFSDPPQLFDKAAFKANDETITGQWTFSTFPITPANATSSETVGGVVELATGAEASAGTRTGTTGARLVIPASQATSTFNRTSASTTVVTDSSNKIDDGFLTYGTPIGSLTAYASSTAPIGWLLANGQAVSRTTYADLFAVIGVIYGTGDGSTTFNLPDVTGKSIVMASSTQTALDGQNRATLGSIGTTTSHTMSIGEMPAHTHTTAFRDTGGAVGDIVGGNGNNVQGSDPSSSTGGGAAFNTLDPYIILYYIIKF